MPELTYIKEIDVRFYNQLRDMVKWGALNTEEAQSGIDNAFAVISCKDGEKTVGVARMIWDHGYTAFLSDVIVHTEYRRRGIASTMIEKLLEDLRKQLKHGWKIKVNLMAASGKEEFYTKFGFQVRPYNNAGAGMDMWLE